MEKQFRLFRKEVSLKRLKNWDHHAHTFGGAKDQPRRLLLTAMFSLRPLAGQIDVCSGFLGNFFESQGK